MRAVLNLVPVVIEQHPELSNRTLAVLCGDAWSPWHDRDRERSKEFQRVFVNAAESQIAVHRAVQAGVVPEFRSHDSFVWELSRWLDAAGWATQSEFSTRINADDRNPRRADLVIGEADEDGFMAAPLIVVEVKTAIRSAAQAKAAAEQALTYCAGCQREWGEMPLPVVVAGLIGPSAPKVIEGVQVLSPDEFVEQLGRPEVAAGDFPSAA